MQRLITLILFFITSALAGQRPCERLPDSTTLLQLLTTRPIRDVGPRDFLEGCNVTPAIRQRALQLLDWEWPAEELDSYVFQFIDTNKIKEHANGDGKVYDSLLKNEKLKFVKQMEKNHYFTVRKEETLLPGKLFMIESVPILEKALPDSLHYDRFAIKLCLARLGNKKYQQEIISGTNNNTALNDQQWRDDASTKVRQLMYILTQESIQKIASFMDTSKSYNTLAHGEFMVKSVHFIVWILHKIILNEDFKAKYDWDLLYNTDRTNNEVILYCREWLLKNKGRYKLNKNYVLY